MNRIAGALPTLVALTLFTGTLLMLLAALGG